MAADNRAMPKAIIPRTPITSYTATTTDIKNATPHIVLLVIITSVGLMLQYQSINNKIVLFYMETQTPEITIRTNHLINSANTTEK